MKHIFDMGTSTFTNAPAPTITLESLTKIKEDLEAKFPLAKYGDLEVSEAKWLPEGYTVMVGHNSMVWITPQGKLFGFRRRDTFSKWEPENAERI